ncbi:MAG TPA: ATP synthase F0 subunit B [Terriglobales bacterium]|nr:ATP synthase F0 subunit B [Terriglobales bacterium]
MDETLRQLGELLLRSIPTIIFFLVLFAAYRFLVHNPLERVLQERHARTEGAVEQARADIANAENKTAAYEQRLREARMAVFKAQEARRQQALQSRSALVNQAREKARAKVNEAKSSIERDKEQAQVGLQAEAQRLAREIVRIILRPAGVAQTPVASGSND